MPQRPGERPGLPLDRHARRLDGCSDDIQDVLRDPQGATFSVSRLDPYAAAG